MSSLKQPVHGRDHTPWGFDPTRDLRWFFVTPISPATKGIDDANAADEGGYPEFEDPWVNVGGDAAATAFSVAVGGKLMIRLGCTGGEDEAPSLIFTVPEPFRSPGAGFEFKHVPMGEDGTTLGSVKVNLDDGTVTFMGFVTLDGGTP